MKFKYDTWSFLHIMQKLSQFKVRDYSNKKCRHGVTYNIELWQEGNC
jgi:hypothetical protein